MVVIEMKMVCRFLFFFIFFFFLILPLERHKIFDRGQDTGLKLDRTWPLDKPTEQVRVLIRRIFASFYG